eukprot:scaffold67920_cov60-Phaeocystis_antarctica.AAC.3
MRLERRAAGRRGERETVGQRVEHVHAARPAERRAARPDRAAAVLLRHHRHHERRVHCGGRAHEHAALVAAVPDDQRGVRRKAAHHVPKLAVLQWCRLGRVAALRELHVMVDEQPVGVARIIEGVGQEHAAAPHTHHRETRLLGRAHHRDVRARREPPLELLHRDHVGTTRPEHNTVNTKVHAVTTRALRGPRLRDIRGVGVVAGDERDVTEAD